MVWVEVETKIKIEDSLASEYREKIRKIARFEKKGKKADDYFAILDGENYPKKAFRIRAMGDTFEVNFKKWLTNYWTKEVVVKQEFEFVLKGREQVEDLLELFRDLGFSEWIKKIKWNETYKWKKDKNISIELNKIEHLGYFIEIEYLCQPHKIKIARNKIHKILKELKIKPEQIDNTGYTKMLWYKGTKEKHKFLK